jgi:hypothetical protein
MVSFLWLWMEGWKWNYFQPNEWWVRTLNIKGGKHNINLPYRFYQTNICNVTLCTVSYEYFICIFICISTRNSLGLSNMRQINVMLCFTPLIFYIFYISLVENNSTFISIQHFSEWQNMFKVHTKKREIFSKLFKVRTLDKFPSLRTHLTQHGYCEGGINV